MAALPNYIPYLRHKSVSTTTWASAGNTDTITDADIHSNSIIVIQHTSQHAGRWFVTTSEGSATITSSDVEDTNVTYNYLIL